VVRHSRLDQEAGRAVNNLHALTPVSTGSGRGSACSTNARTSS
jgi:hypothetical protein